MHSVQHTTTTKTHLQHEEDRNERQTRPTIHGGARDVVELAPPRKVPLPDEVLEDEAHQEPARVVYARRGWDLRDAVQDDRRRDVLDPRVWMPPLPEPEGEGEEDADDHRVEVRVVDRVRAELAHRADETPMKE